MYIWHISHASCACSHTRGRLYDAVSRRVTFFNFIGVINNARAADDSSVNLLSDCGLKHAQSGSKADARSQGDSYIKWGGPAWRCYNNAQLMEFYLRAPPRLHYIHEVRGSNLRSEIDYPTRLFTFLSAPENYRTLPENRPWTLPYKSSPTYVTDYWII